MSKCPSGSFRSIVCRFPLRIAQERTQSLKLRRSHTFLNLLEFGDGMIGWIGSPRFIARLSVFQRPPTTFFIMPKSIPIYQEGTRCFEFWPHRAVQKIDQLLLFLRIQVLWPPKHKESMLAQCLTYLSHFIPTRPGSKRCRPVLPSRGIAERAALKRLFHSPRHRPAFCPGLEARCKDCPGLREQALQTSPLSF